MQAARDLTTSSPKLLSTNRTGTLAGFLTQRGAVCVAGVSWPEWYVIVFAL